MIIYPYRIEECGFYKRGEKHPEFGTLDQFLPEFVKWINSRENIQATATFRDEESPIPSVYCVEAFPISNYHEYVVVLWNEIPQHEEGINSIPIDGKVGNVQASTNRMEDESIPGWPTYLIIVPSKSLIVSLIPDNMRGHRSPGIVQARRYLKSYLKHKSPYAKSEIINEDLTVMEKKISGWSHEEKTMENLYTRLSTKELKRRGNLNKVYEEYNNIYKIVSKTSLNFRIPRERSILFKTMKNVMGFNVTEKNNDQVNYRVELDWTPNREEISEIIGTWENKINVKEVNYEVGVKFSGESDKIYWFSESRGRFELEIPENLERETLWTESQINEVWSLTKNRVYQISRESIK